MTSVPWVEQLLRDPAAALAALLNHDPLLGPWRAGEPEDAAQALLDDEAPDGPAWKAFDAACLDHLIASRAALAATSRQAGGPAQRLYDLLAVVRRTLPPDTVLALHRDVPGWLDFFESFVFDRGFDLRREVLRLLALSQEQAETADPVALPPRRLMPLWLTLCGESGPWGRYDDSYLPVGLLGLRRLTLGAEFDANEDFVLQGLARWAMAQAPARDAFLREWRIVEGDFPRQPRFWAGRVATVLAQVEHELREHQGRSSFPAATWWREELGLEPPDRDECPHAPARTPRPPAQPEWNAILQSIGSPLSTLRPVIDRMMQRQEHYATATGDVFYLVRTACNIGSRLIRRPPAAERVGRGETAVRLALIALRYEPDNPYAWALWRDGLTEASRPDEAELVGWEAIRRYPENPQWRTQLATLLADERERPEEARALLRQTVALFPTDAVARTQLATLLAGPLGQAAEAAVLLEETVALFPADAIARNRLATVLAEGLDHRVEAEAILAQAQAEGIGDTTTRSLLTKLRQGKPLRARATARPARRPATPSHGLAEGRRIAAGAAARRQLFLAETGAMAEAAPPPDTTAYALFATGWRQTEPVGLPTFALAFEEALKRADPSPLRAMVAQARPLERAMIEAAIALSEGRIVALSALSATPSAVERRWAALQHRLRATPPEQARLLLRDFAGSLLAAA